VANTGFTCADFGDDDWLVSSARMESDDERYKIVPADPDKYPHKCTLCGRPAYVGLNSIECSNKKCVHGRKSKRS
jgi:hypothetical protein